MTAEELAAACRFLDTKTKELVGGAQAVEDVLQGLVGVEYDDLNYIASQRSLRIILHCVRGQLRATAKMEKVELSPVEHAMDKLLTLASIDGIAIGLAAAKGLAEPLPPTTSLN
jgi:hypothetical protein